MYKDHEMPLFWKTYSEPLRIYTTAKMQDKHAVEDVLHEVYLKVFCYCKRFEFSCEKAGVKNLGSWIFRVCHNTIMDHHKKNSRFVYINCIGETNACDAGPVDELRQDIIHELVSTLPAKYADPLIYDSIHSMKQSAIAKKLGISLTATKSRIQRGRKMLRERYNHLLEN